ncbi:restriction endonuclease subunit S, partial [Nostoc sp.]|uniref:restriction endonuclease subunit S n=1 Tax=Nostoc sp. TaxID=1180 RepID=UPI002FF94E99
SNNVAVIRPIVEIDPVYLAVLMRSKWLEQQLATLYLQSSTIQLIPISQLRSLKIPLPNLETQNKLAQLFLATERANRITLEILDTRNNLSEFTLFQTLEGQK